MAEPSLAMTSDRPYDDFLRVPEAKSVKNRLYPDLRGTDLAAATEQALLLGATRADDVYDGSLAGVVCP